MSRKQDRGASQPKVFISFGDVAGGFRPLHDDAPGGKTSAAPLYSGSDAELSVISKKLLKKDNTTKLKAIHDLPAVLKSKEEHVVAEFLTYFVYCFNRLCIEDSRSVRQYLSLVIDAVVAVEKRLLAPHMKALIGPWWMLTGDPAGEVAESALAAFNNAIPPKKRQQVLTYLAPSILKESMKNMRHKAGTLSDLSVTTPAEAAERLERVLVSTIASTGKLMSMLMEEQNQQLSGAAAAEETDNSAGYRDLVSDQFWTTALESDFAHVRKAAYQLIPVVATHASDLLLVDTSTSSETTAAASRPLSKVFVRLLLDALRSEKHGPNLTFLLDAFLSVLRQMKGFFEQVSVSEELLPLAEYLLETHPQLAVEYLLPIIGSLPPKDVALLERSQSGSNEVSTAAVKSMDGLCQLLVGLSSVAESRIVESSTGLSAIPDMPRARSAHNRRRIAESRAARLRGVQAESVIASMRADVCVVEISTLLLLRRCAVSAETTSSIATSDASTISPVSEQVEEVVSMLVQSVVLSLQNAAASIQGASRKQSALWTALTAATPAVPSGGAEATKLTESAKACTAAISKSLLQLQRATLMDLHVSSAQWTTLFWRPLADGLLDLFLATSSGAAQATSGGACADTTVTEVNHAAELQMMTEVLRLSDLLIDTVSPAWEEKPQADAATVVSAGVKIIPHALVELIASALQAAHPADECVTVSARSLLWSQVLLALDAKAKRLCLPLHESLNTSELLTGDWLCPVLGAVSAPSPCADVFAGGFLEIVTHASSAARASPDGARHLQKLLQQCIAAGSVENVSLLSSRAPGIVWSASAAEWASNKGRSSLLSTSVSGGELRFLVLLSCNASLEQITLQWLVASQQQFGSAAGKFAQSYLLSMMVIALRAPGIRLSLPSKVQEAVTAWMQTSAADLHGVLTKLFFARLRNRENSWKSKEAPATSATAQYSSVLDEVRVVRDWTDVQGLLIPVLPAATSDELATSIVRVLNFAVAGRSQSTGMSMGTEADGQDGDAQDGADESAASSQLQPKKWCRHLSGLLALAATIKRDGAVKPVRDVSTCISVFSPGYWRTALVHKLAAPNQSLDASTLFALECVETVLREDDTAIARFHPSAELLFWVLCLAQASASAGLVSAVTGYLAQMSTERRSECYAEFLALSVTPQDLPAEVGDALQLIAAQSLQTILRSEYSSSVGVERATIRLQSPVLERDARSEQGAPGVYLNWKPASPSASGVVGALTKISAIPCKLAAVHREAGSDPYFTIAMDHTGDAAVAHELQVEWPKLVMGKHLPVGVADFVTTYTADDAFTADSVEDEASPSTVTDVCVQWLMRHFASLMAGLATLATPVPEDQKLREVKLMHELKIFTTVLRETADGMEATSRRKTVETALIAPLRGAAIFLTSGKARSDPVLSCTVGLELLHALPSTQMGTGHGLWLPAALANLRFTLPRLLADTGLSGLQRDQLCADGAAALAALLRVSPRWGLCADVSEALLAPSLQALPSPYPDLAPALLDLLQGVWMHRSQHRGDKPDVAVVSDVAAWETEGFDFALFVMVNGLKGQGSGARQAACAAMHYCLLNRTRRSTRDLMAPSLVEKFTEQLEQLTFTECAADDALAHSTLRLTCCKVLDAWQACRSDGSGPQLAAAKGPAADTVESVEESSMTIQEQEQKELQEDEQLLQEVVGPLCAKELRRRFLVSETDVLVGDSNYSELGEDEDDESAPSTPVKSAEVESTQGAEVGVQSRRVSKRAALRVMLHRDPFGSVLVWMLLLQRIDSCAVQGWAVRARCVNYLKKSGIATNALFLVLRLAGDLLQFKEISALLQRIARVTSLAVPEAASSTSTRPKKQGEGSQQSASQTIEQGTQQHLATYALFRMVCTLPAMFRSFWSDDCNRVQKTRLNTFVEERVRVSLIKREIAMIALSASAGRWNPDEFTVKGSAVSGEVTAVLSRDETTVEIKVKLPASYPLKNVEVNCTSRIGVSDGRWRRWVLQIIQLMSMQDGSVVDAVLLWKCNIEKELEGVEPCPICYCTLHTKTLCLPTMACPTCNNKFHSPCLTTWFRSSGKSKCVICQQPFYH